MSNWREYGIETDMQAVRNRVEKSMLSAKQNLAVLAVVVIAVALGTGGLFGERLGIYVGGSLFGVLVVAYCMTVLSIRKTAKGNLAEVSMRAADRLRTGEASSNPLNPL